MAESSSAPLITGLSPTEGTPGTLVTIRGENLGVDQNDLQMLFICGTDCLHSAKWKSRTKIVARLGQANRGLGEIKIATKSGGRGTCNLKFRVFIAQIGPLEESAVWVDESRTVPGRETIRNVASVPEETDALGLKPRKKMDPALLSREFSDGSGNLRMESFNPQCYLLENHYDSTIEELREGLKNLELAKLNESKRSEDMHKAHLYSLISCVNTLAELHTRLEQHKGDMAVASIIGMKVSEAREKAESVFRDVLTRKDAADATRNSLSLLTRFKFIFFLPKSIDENMAKGDYSTILNEYTRAKSLLKGSDVELFKEVMVEVEKKMGEFREELRHRLIHSSASFEEQSKLIKYLKMLDTSSDPAWDCITSYHCWLEDELWKLQDACFKKSISQIRGDAEVDDSSSRRFFVSELVEFLLDKLQVFWKLSVTFNKVDEGYEERQKDIDQMVRLSINVSSWLLLNALVPETLPNEIRSQYNGQFVVWPAILPSAKRPLTIFSIKTLRSAISSLLECQLSLSHVQPLVQLCSTIRLKSILHAIDQSVQIVSMLGNKENWQVTHLEKGASKTSLPDYFEAEVCDCIVSLREEFTHNSFPGEVDVFTSDMMRQTLVENTVRLVCSVRLAFEKLLHLRRKDQTSEATAQVSPKKLLISVCNVEYIVESSLKKITQRLRETHFKYSDVVYEKSRAKLLSFRQILITHFVSIKNAALFSVIQSMNYGSGVPLDSSEDEVSEWAKELLISVVLAQAELTVDAPQLSKETTKVLVQSAIQAVLSYLGVHPPRGRSALSQCLIDLTAIEQALGAFLSLEGRTMLNSFRAGFIQHLDQARLLRCISSMHSSIRVALASLSEAAQAQGIHDQQHDESDV